MDLNNTDNLILSYFMSGLHYHEIVAFLYLKHGVEMSLATLKRKLKLMKLKRRNNNADLSDIVNFIQSELATSGQLCGYRWMHRRCIQSNYVVSQNTVRILLQELDPEGVEFRKRKRLRRRKYVTKGPNYMWHMDAYDKLTPYGISISGAIDGFSRHIIWLRAGRTASNPKVISGYFINSIKKYGGCPRRIRFDCGTENVGIEKLQQILRENPADNSDLIFGPRSFIYGTSQCNQRIESWWSILRKHTAQFWMNLFQGLKEEGHFAGSTLDKALIQFCFLNIFQKELNQIAYEWNTHPISGSRNAVSPKGRPVIMFELSELYNTKNFLCTVDNKLLEECERECLYFILPCETDIYELCKILMNEKNLTIPQDAHSAVELYITLRNTLNIEYSIN